MIYDRPSKPLDSCQSDLLAQIRWLDPRRETQLEANLSAVHICLSPSWRLNRRAGIATTILVCMHPQSHVSLGPLHSSRVQSQLQAKRKANAVSSERLAHEYSFKYPGETRRVLLPIRSNLFGPACRQREDLPCGSITLCENDTISGTIH